MLAEDIPFKAKQLKLDFIQKQINAVSVQTSLNTEAVLKNAYCSRLVRFSIVSDATVGSTTGLP